MEKLLIMGVDPGTVSAYALIDIDGNLVSLGSKRGADHKNLIFEVSKHGKPFLIGCDVSKCPGMVAKIGRVFGAKIVSPDHDLKYFEKIKIVDSYLKTKKEFINIQNKHEKDALAAALFGLKRINGLVKKIQDHLKQNNKIHLVDDVRKKVLIDGFSISEAVKAV